MHSENPVEVRAGYVGSLRISFPKLMEVDGLGLSASLSASPSRPQPQP